MCNTLLKLTSWVNHRPCKHPKRHIKYWAFSLVLGGLWIWSFFLHRWKIFLRFCSSTGYEDSIEKYNGVPKLMREPRNVHFAIMNFWLCSTTPHLLCYLKNDIHVHDKCEQYANHGCLFLHTCCLSKGSTGSGEKHLKTI